MKLAVVSPLPPAPTGVAEFTARLAQELRRSTQVDLFEAAPDQGLASYDARLYQIGNNPLHAGAYKAALAEPGVVELHDAVLHHFQLGRLDHAAYVEEFVYNYGAATRTRAEELWQRRGQASVGEEYFRHALLRRLAESAGAIVVHNPGAERLARQACATARIVEIPHYVEPLKPPPAGQVAAFRKKLEAPDGVLLIACLGFQRPTKRLRSVLEAVRRAPYRARLLIAGDFVSADYEASLAPLVAQVGAVRLPYVSAEELRVVTAAADVCVNLRWPTAGETSGIAMKMMAAGKPVLLTDCPENSRFPDSAVFRVDSGEAELEMLDAGLRLLAAEPSLRRQMGAQAAAYVAEHHGLSKVVPEYLRTLSSAP